VNYENTSYSDEENNGKAADGKGDKAKKPEVTKEINGNSIVTKEPLIPEPVEESVSAPAAKKSKPQAVKSAAPPK